MFPAAFLLFIRRSNRLSAGIRSDGGILASHLPSLLSQVFDTCRLPINLADPSYSSFIQQVLPKLVERNIGVLGMKSLANGGFFGGSAHGQHGNNPKISRHRHRQRIAFVSFSRFVHPGCRNKDCVGLSTGS